MIILKLRIRTPDEWRELAPGDSVGEPVFVPTTDELEPGQQVVIEVSSQLLPNKVLVRGAVQTWRPALPRMRVRAGHGRLATDGRSSSVSPRGVRGRRTDVPRRHNLRLPVQLMIRYRLTNSASHRLHGLRDRVGGALLTTTPHRSTPS
jgi:hypothetical protein